jgi:RNA polymerase-binding transcription factor
MTDTATRHTGLRQALQARRREMQEDVRSRIRDGRVDRLTEGRDDLETSEADSQGDLGLALIQMRMDTIARVDEALIRLDAGRYGACAECAGEIAERRLCALPFAVRCQACQDRRERQHSLARRLTERQGPSPFASPAWS